ncbi:hypothetical protein L1987_84268 [Smallanthus sonchifolius]|uniref:Uncharacterized protein n=1 Tax=Smallanthus sonchifolius TaxID=185202 RepID=A0ACB8YEF3_9ASTR|nr:hypothetical protein L1987_84268 [Smallanthus sonchifolius]
MIRRDIQNQNNVADDRIVRSALARTKRAKWVMRVVGVVSILSSSFDTPLAMVSLASCLALNYVINSIRAQISKKIELLKWAKLRDSWIREYFVGGYVVAEWATVTGFREWVLTNPHRIMMIPRDR